jgi:hypothetical protein
MLFNAGLFEIGVTQLVVTGRWVNGACDNKHG